MYLNVVTIQDCQEMQRMKGMAVELNDGKVIGFRHTVDKMEKERPENRGAQSSIHIVTGNVSEIK